MLGNALYYLHRAFQAFAAWCRCDDDPHPLVKQVESRRAWLRFQAEVRRQRDARRADHARNRDITERQKKTVNAALASYVQQRNLTHG